MQYFLQISFLIFLFLFKSFLEGFFGYIKKIFAFFIAYATENAKM